MPAKLTFITVTAAAALGCAVIAGLITAVIGLSAKMPTADLITAATGTAAAAFSGVIALSAIAAGLFFTSPPAAQDTPAVPPPGQPAADGKPRAIPVPGRAGTAQDRKLRAAVRTSTLLSKSAQDSRRGPGTR